MLSHPSSLAAPPALKMFFSPNASEPDCYFIHEITVQRSCWSKGVGTRLFAQALRIVLEHGFPTMALVAVQNSQSIGSALAFNRSPI